MKKEIEASLKSIETENYIDRVFYRPIGYKIAKSLTDTGVTPNLITIISIFIGIASGILWYFPYNITFALLGIAALIIANILDCVDGQLARLTGIKSEVGRILDGIAGDLWFVMIYIAFVHRSNIEFNTWIFWIVAALSGWSHLNQAALTDYYKTLHLFFVSKEKGKEFENSESIKIRLETMPKGINRFITILYLPYTKNQERQTPHLQKLLANIKLKYGSEIPEDVRLSFRKGSGNLMKLIDWMTFNGRSIILFIAVLTNTVWLYFIWDIIVLNILKRIIRVRHEKMCQSFEY
ncbi:MAG: CDP-alcohol phosphatidyltransferase family protein [Paludibacteraceae bacterium]